jgi:flagellar biosynthesis GTPase FlhF
MMKNRAPGPNAIAPTFNANQQQPVYRDGMNQQLNALQQQQQQQQQEQQRQQQEQQRLQQLQQQQLQQQEQQRLKQQQIQQTKKLAQSKPQPQKVSKAPAPTPTPTRSVSMSSQHQAIAAALNSNSEPETPYNNIGKGGAGMGKGGSGMGKGKNMDDGPSGKDLKFDFKSEHIKSDPDGDNKMDEGDSEAGCSMVKREIKDEPMDSNDVKPPMLEPIPQPAGTSEKKKCSK